MTNSYGTNFWNIISDIYNTLFQVNMALLDDRLMQPLEIEYDIVSN